MIANWISVSQKKNEKPKSSQNSIFDKVFAITGFLDEEKKKTQKTDEGGETKDDDTDQGEGRPRIQR